MGTCRTIDRGIPHPGDIAEAASLRQGILSLQFYDMYSSRQVSSLLFHPVDQSLTECLTMQLHTTAKHLVPFV